MTFMCQRDSYLREFTTEVVSCEPTFRPIVEYGKTTNFQGYEVVLKDTLLFPAGGGQPHDLGWLNDIEVFQVVRNGSVAVHYTKEPIPVGTIVRQKLNWGRRFDHMQQHTGQHLISAVLDKKHEITTSSWWLGAQESYVELDAVVLNEAIIESVMFTCNDMIQNAVPVYVKTCSTSELLPRQAHTRGLPADNAGPIRIISIGNYDENMCCGTHVCNLSHLQAVQYIGMEPGKRGKVNLKFQVGNRIFRNFQTMLERQQALTRLLNNEPSMHNELVSKLQSNLKNALKYGHTILMELARFEVKNIKATKPKFVFMYKGTPEFNRAILKELQNDSLFMLFASDDPDKPKEGHIIMQGPEEHWKALGEKIIETLEAKGAFKNGMFQGKAKNMMGINRCELLIEEYFKEHETKD